MSRKHLISFIICSVLFPLLSLSLIPVTGQNLHPSPENPGRLPHPLLQNFSSSPGDIKNTITRVEASGYFSLPVVEQPANNPSYVANQSDILTHFALAERYGTTALIAHNHHAGSEFFALQPGDRVNLLRKNRELESYWVTSIRSFRALRPTSPHSDFIDLQNGDRLTASELFLEMYGPGDRLVFQTCIAKDGSPSWGRLFVTALPIPEKFLRQSLVSFPSLTDYTVQ